MKQVKHLIKLIFFDNDKIKEKDPVYFDFDTFKQTSLASLASLITIKDPELKKNT